MALLSVSAASELIRQEMPDLPDERCALAAAAGAVLRQTVVAERDQPPFDRVTMDGVALSSAAFQRGARSFALQGSQGAGAAALQLHDAGHCIEIMTGAVLPRGCDCVVPVERINIDHNTVRLDESATAAPGQFVHAQGSDHSVGAALLLPGMRIGAAEMAVLASAGHAEVNVARRPAIAVVSTGDELVDVGVPIEPFQIRSSNGRAIETALRLRGLERIERVRLPDAPDILRERIAALHAANDVLILSGGVSMGKYDYIPGVMEDLGVRLILHKIAQRPGLPMWFGVSEANKPIFALPGNPVSTLVCLIRYVVPAIEQAMGSTPNRPEPVILTGPVEFAPSLTYFLPVQVGYQEDGRVGATPRPTNTSGDFASLAGTDGFVGLAQSRQTFEVGHVADFYRW